MSQSVGNNIQPDQRWEGTNIHWLMWWFSGHGRIHTFKRAHAHTHKY